MGFLHKIWDETLAGPAPDSGLGKLRKYNSLSTPVSSVQPPGDDPPVPVSRAITIVRHNSAKRPNLTVTVESSSMPSSSPASSTPATPRTRKSLLFNFFFFLFFLFWRGEK